MRYIYKIECKINNKVYIGQTYNYDKRFREHRNNLKANRHINPYLQADYNKYGLNNFTFDIIEEITDAEDNLAIEDRWIDCYGGIDSDNTYNVTNQYHKNKLFCNKLSTIYKGISHKDRYGECKAEEMRKVNSEKHLGKVPAYIPSKGKVKTLNGDMLIVTEQIYRIVKRLRSKGLTYKQISSRTNIKECGVRNIVLDNIHLSWKCND